jgi:hypothetical protein
MSPPVPPNKRAAASRQLVMVVSDKEQDAGVLWHVEDDGMEQRLRTFIAGRRHFEQTQQ